MIEVRQLKKSFGDRDILNDISFQIEEGERIGLVGWNGCGKTTLVNILLGLLAQDSGTISVEPTVSFGYLPQSTDYNLSFSGEPNDRRDDSALLQTMSELSLNKHHWDNAQWKHLSGGEKLKLSLAAIWSTNPNFLILDEPTNHLDIAGIHWLVGQIQPFAGSTLIISHDRYFLDQTATKIFELEDGALHEYTGNYSMYREEKKAQREKHLRDYRLQQKKMERIHQQIATLKQWSNKADREAGKSRSGSENRQIGLKEYEKVKAKKKDKQIKSKLNRLEAELAKEGIDKPKEEYSISFQFHAREKRGRRVLEAKDLKKEFSDKVLFDNSSFYVKHGEIVGLSGPNGCGKTTFIKMLLGKEEITGGTLWRAPGLRVAYLSQDVDDLPGTKTALAYLDIHDREKLRKARTILANMGMEEEKLSTPIADLSLGERTKVKLVYILMQEYDVLILDEPTNHLDLPSREQLEETLTRYTGTLLIVSHDYYLINKLCQKLLIIDNHRIQRVETGLSDWEEQQKRQTVLQADKKAKKEDLALIETKIIEILGKLSHAVPNSEEYQRLEQQFSDLSKRKQQLLLDIGK
ncbi:macrolide transport system ATP-binding/permease protein [Evansella caseinilytica]|uniref:Macrolide transport system ATP-binding/permease protein n=1 Tax=Evansella caseinilytica TaxID=1503961 RepID=A0A1H3UMF3_9BACI|nr:ABC-F type ribosomal protection protein [Evansella caseinilytica]SDZ63231.1 macrolide transport system ATP-binding/permease protein [Evansella caseinilytica]